MTTRTVLIPLDGSPFSQAILPHVRRVLKPDDYRIVLLRVAHEPEGLVPEPPRPVSTAWMVPMYASAADYDRARHPIYASQEWASRQAALANQMLADVHMLEDAGFTVSVAVEAGFADDAIVDFIDREHIDMVAMTTHGWTGMRHLLLGSVAEFVLRNVAVPVMLICPFERMSEPREVRPQD